MLAYQDLSKTIIGCALHVHNTLGNGFQEVIYQRALAIEMEYARLRFEREKSIMIYYRDCEIGERRVDFLIEGLFCVELKALLHLEPVHQAQAINYLEAFRLTDGLLINFGAPRLEWKRVFNNRHASF